jgi:hypothetical protein
MYFCEQCYLFIYLFLLLLKVSFSSPDRIALIHMIYVSDLKCMLCPNEPI